MRKIVIVLVLLSAAGRPAEAQFFKDLLNSVKQTAQSRANNKASQTTNKAIDKVDPSMTTAKPSGTPGNTQAAPITPAGGSAGGANGGTAGGDPESTAGYVRAIPSTNQTIVGGSVKITGFSPLNGSLKNVVLTVSGPVPAPAKNIPLKDSGSFSTIWVPASSGQFRLLFKTADGKAQKTLTINAYPFEEMDRITGPTRTEVTQAEKKIEDAINKAKDNLSANDAAKLDEKMTKLKKKVTDFTKLLDDIDKAGKGLDGLQKKYGPFPQPLRDKFTTMSDDFGKESEQLHDFNNGGGGGAGGSNGAGTGYNNHSSYDNTICEYLVMVSEACAAFSAFANFEGDIVKVVGNIAADKGASVVAGDEAAAAGAGDNTKTFVQESAKLFSTAALDGNSILSTEGTAGFCGDIVQMCSGILLKTYCVVMDGELQENYTCTFRNANSNVWWQYNYTAGATISFRYPKGSSKGGVIKMKGNIEGNATKFSIYTNVDQMDEFKTASKGRVHAIPVCVYAPPSVPFVSSKADKATGFGAVARTIATPACFNLPIDVDYDVDAKTMKFFVNPALVDFSPMVQYIYCYLVIAAGIPLTTRVDFPINKAYLTLGKVISLNNTFPVKMDANNNSSVAAKGNSKLGGGSAIEHNISFSFSAKSN